MATTLRTVAPVRIMGQLRRRCDIDTASGFVFDDLGLDPTRVCAFGEAMYQAVQAQQRLLSLSKRALRALPDGAMARPPGPAELRVIVL